MTSPESWSDQDLLRAFRMPAVQTMVTRKSSITNAFVNSIIPIVQPTPEEIRQALKILAMSPADVRCVYCGDKSTEWDHLRALVRDRRPTGFISEIANLVPACGKCNQSKGNKPWKQWLTSAAKLSPAGRGIQGSELRIAALVRFELWCTPTNIDFRSIISESEWDAYWALCDQVNHELERAYQVAIAIQSRVAGRVTHKT